MSGDGGEALPDRPPRSGILRPGRWQSLRAFAWCIVFAYALRVTLALHFYIDAAGLGLDPDGPIILLPYALRTVLALAIYLLGVRLVERRAPSELALGGFVRELAAGLLVGALVFAAVMGVLLAAGSYTLTGPAAAIPWRALALTLESGVVEELLCGGVVLRLLWAVLGMRWALVISAALFGLMHLMNRHSDLIAALAIAIEAGLLLGALYVLTGRLWASIGAHMAWNFTQGYVFGARVSGTSFGPSLFRAEPAADAGALWSGGAVGTG